VARRGALARPPRAPPRWGELRLDGVCPSRPCSCVLTLGSRFGVVLQPHMKLSLAYPVAGTQKLIEIDDDAKLCVALSLRLLA